MASADIIFKIEIGGDGVAVLDELAAIHRRLTRIEQALRIEGEMIMSELSDLLTPVTDALVSLDDDLKATLDHLLARLNGKLDAEEKQMLADALTKISAMDAFVKTADPGDPSAPAAPAASSGDQPAADLGTASPTTDPASAGVVDGAQGQGTVGDGGDPTAVDSGHPIL